MMELVIVFGGFLYEDDCWPEEHRLRTIVGGLLPWRSITFFIGTTSTQADAQLEKMEDCGRVVQLQSCAISGAQDMSAAADIARRFEQLETQWISFQKKSETCAGDKDNLQKSTTCSPRNHLQRNTVSSAASSYSNPLFTNDTIGKSSQTAGDRLSAASTRIDTPYGESPKNSRRTPSSCLRHLKAGTATTTPRNVIITKDDSLSSQVTPSTSMLSSPQQNCGKTSKDGQISPSSEAMYTRATVPTFFCEKPPLSPAVQPVSEAPTLGTEKHVSCAQQTSYKKSEQRRELKKCLQLPEILGLQCLKHSTLTTKITNGERSRKCEAGMIERVHSITFSSSVDPATCSSGKGPPESLGHLGPASDTHIDQPRSSPSTSQASVAVADLHSSSLSGDGGVSNRKVSLQVLGERGVPTEEVLRQDNHPSEVNWELRLSKREAALRIAEETILEEQQNMFQARLAVSKSEDALRLREQELLQESEKQKSNMEGSLKSTETGKAVMNKLCIGLKDLLCNLERKEKVFQDIWLEIKDSVDAEIVFGKDHSFGFEPEVSEKDRRSATFDSVSFLIAEGECEEWCSTVVGICERLVGYMSRETHIQKWATVLEREGMRMAKMIKEMTKAKKAASEQCARSEEMMKCAEGQAACMDEERVKLANERHKLILWVNHLQERQNAVAECEKEAATSLVEIQKKAADLFVYESNLDGKALESSALQEELRTTSQRLQDDKELINREKYKVQEKLRQAAVREIEAGFNICSMEKLQEELNSKAEQLEKDIAIDEQRKEKLLLILQETEGRINAKELSLRELEKEMELKNAAAEEMTNSLNEREKLFSELQKEIELERSKMREMMASLEKDKLRLKDADKAEAEAHSLKKSAEEAWTRTTQDRRESTEYLKSVEERLKQWEDRLCSKEKELQESENLAREELEHSKALRAKLAEEQESWKQELLAKQELLQKRNRLLEAKEEEITNDLEKLTEERRIALEDIKRLSEMEEQAWDAEEWQTKHEEHLNEVRKHASDYHRQQKDLELAKRELNKEFEEVRAKKHELKVWQREAEKTLQNRIDSFINGKEELTSQINELKNLQVDIEQAGSQIIDRVAELDEASTSLEHQRHKVETSKTRLEGLADNIALHQEVLKRRESEFLAQEEKLVTVQNGLKKMAADIATKEKNLRSREQAVIDSENDLLDVEARLISERKDLEKMIAEVEQHAAKLKEETAFVGENSRYRTRDELMIEEKREKLQVKEQELENFEIDLRTKAKRLEEYGQTISKLEIQVKERLQKADEFETKSEELEKGWERLAFEREILNRAKLKIQKSPEIHKVQWKLDLDKDEIVKKVEVMDGLCAREVAIEVREAEVIEREAVLLKMERQTKAHKDQVENDAQELRQQLHSARAELEDQRLYVDEKRKAAEIFANDIKEREARLKRKEQELSNRIAIDQEKGHHGGEGKLYKHQRAPVLVHNQTDEDMEDRIRKVEEAAQKEAAKVLKERDNLELQQQDLEERRKAVEEVKMTVTTQLKATKKMVADASLTAQNVSREREALEEERKRLVRDQENAEAALAAKEAKLALEAKQLENMKDILNQEMTKSMELMQQAAKRAMGAEHAKSKSIVHREIQCDSRLMDIEKEFHLFVNANQGEKSSSREERKQMEHSHVSSKNAAKDETLIKDAEIRMALEKLLKRKENKRMIGEAQDWNQTPEGSSNDGNHKFEQKFSFPALKNNAGEDLGEGSERSRQASHMFSSTNWDEAFDSTTSSMSAAYSQITSENLTVNSKCCQTLGKDGVPSRKTLENVMSSLMHARHASRSRLQRTENALLAFPPLSGFITQVQQTLMSLSARLNRMEEVEERLANHLRNAYKSESSESQDILDVDKMQLLCRMEEQQCSRAEWEEDMRRQLENISMLQAASRSSPDFNTLPRVSAQDDWQNHNINMHQDGKRSVHYEKVENGGVVENSNADLCCNKGPRLSKHLQKCNTVFQPHEGEDSKKLSYFPC